MHKQKHKQTNFIYLILTLQNNYLDRLSRKELNRLVENTVTHANILLFHESIEKSEKSNEVMKKLPLCEIQHKGF